MIRGILNVLTGRTAAWNSTFGAVIEGLENGSKFLLIAAEKDERASNLLEERGLSPTAFDMYRQILEFTALILNGFFYGIDDAPLVKIPLKALPEKRQFEITYRIFAVTTFIFTEDETRQSVLNVLVGAAQDKDLAISVSAEMAAVNAENQIMRLASKTIEALDMEADPLLMMRMSDFMVLVLEAVKSVFFERFPAESA